MSNRTLGILLPPGQYCDLSLVYNQWVFRNLFKSDQIQTHRHRSRIHSIYIMNLIHTHCARDMCAFTSNTLTKNIPTHTHTLKTRTFITSNNTRNIEPEKQTHAVNLRRYLRDTKRARKHISARKLKCDHIAHCPFARRSSDVYFMGNVPMIIPDGRYAPHSDIFRGIPCALFRVSRSRALAASLRMFSRRRFPLSCLRATFTSASIVLCVYVCIYGCWHYL